eukprot:CAMPEP_0174280756 /NCGR_PEP_ID=MMETSP0809-20121228/1058_1 /TAXON_ID=73025 ORGANISM="Eutreptiella gymnastica-like, Strain CCMP1594" /NCGR_SAMPLE_ID=MMETSP0809 /ASSEMBLY_ACC=CAM_ASM_000658 /LENGTH=192 /DNA_ID=CAMNT_0015373853 /DNA_START=39 /DNA_END=617 /DNA_ORIENTATION=-
MASPRAAVKFGQLALCATTQLRSSPSWASPVASPLSCSPTFFELRLDSPPVRQEKKGFLDLRLDSSFQTDSSPPAEKKLALESLSAESPLGWPQRSRRVTFNDDAEGRLVREISSLHDRQSAMGKEPHSPKTIRHSHLPRTTRWTDREIVQLEEQVRPHAGGLFARRMSRRASAEPESSAALFDDMPRRPSV